MTIIEWISGKNSEEERRRREADERRPVKMVPESKNVWRIVYAD